MRISALDSKPPQAITTDLHLISSIAPLALTLTPRTTCRRRAARRRACRSGCRCRLLGKLEMLLDQAPAPPPFDSTVSPPQNLNLPSIR